MAPRKSEAQARQDMAGALDRFVALFGGDEFAVTPEDRDLVGVGELETLQREQDAAQQWMEIQLQNEAMDELALGNTRDSWLATSHLREAPEERDVDYDEMRDDDEDEDVDASREQEPAPRTSGRRTTKRLELSPSSSRATSQGGNASSSHSSPTRRARRELAFEIRMRGPDLTVSPPPPGRPQRRPMPFSTFTRSNSIPARNGRTRKRRDSSTSQQPPAKRRRRRAASTSTGSPAGRSVTRSQSAGPSSARRRRRTHLLSQRSPSSHPSGSSSASMSTSIASQNSTTVRPTAPAPATDRRGSRRQANAEPWSWREEARLFAMTQPLTPADELAHNLWLEQHVGPGTTRTLAAMRQHWRYIRAGGATLVRLQREQAPWSEIKRKDRKNNKG